jgi:hypothetical protein
MIKEKADNLLLSILLIIGGLSTGIFYEDLLNFNKLVLITFTILQIIAIFAGIYHLYKTLEN